MGLAKSSKIYVAGHRGMVGSALVRQLGAEGYDNLVTVTRDRLDLTDQRSVFEFFEQTRPDCVLAAAAKVGGIHANNTYRAEFLYQNLVMEANLVEGARRAGVKRMVFLGSSCIYPRDCPQPIREEYLLTGPLEQTNEPYAIAKIAGVKLCETYNHQYGTRYISVMPTNLYGPNDNYDLKNSHVLPALIRKAHEARTRGDAKLVVWGTGTPRREFLHVDDLARACVFLLETDYDHGLINIGCGSDVTIRELAELVMEAVGLDAELEFDSTKPDGTPRKLLDVSRINGLGWTPRIGLREGIALTYQSFLREHAQADHSSPATPRQE